MAVKFDGSGIEFNELGFGPLSDADDIRVLGSDERLLRRARPSRP